MILPVTNKDVKKNKYKKKGWIDLRKISNAAPAILFNLLKYLFFILWISVNMLIISCFYLAFYDLCFDYYQAFGAPITIVLILIILWILFMINFSYNMACFVNPGSPLDFPN